MISGVFLVSNGTCFVLSDHIVEDTERCTRCCELDGTGRCTRCGVLDVVVEIENHTDLLYLSDVKATLQAIDKWIGGGTKLNLSRSTDADVLEVIILKLEQRL